MNQEATMTHEHEPPTWFIYEVMLYGVAFLFMLGCCVWQIAT